jgi:hypothetical protein
MRQSRYLIARNHNISTNRLFFLGIGTGVLISMTALYACIVGDIYYKEILSKKK